MHGLYGGQPHDVTELKRIFLSAAGMPVALVTVYTRFAALSIRTCAGEGAGKSRRRTRLRRLEVYRRGVGYGSSTISSSFALTGCPSLTRTVFTVPAVRAVMAVSIFIASMTAST